MDEEAFYILNVNIYISGCSPSNRVSTLSIEVVTGNNNTILSDSFTGDPFASPSKTYTVEKIFPVLGTVTFLFKCNGNGGTGNSYLTCRVSDSNGKINDTITSSTQYFTNPISASKQFLIH